MRSHLVQSLAVLVGVGVITLGPASPGRAAPDAQFPVEVQRDIAYQKDGAAASARHQLDLYLPKGAKDFPVLVLVHGGFWMMGDKSFFGWGSALGSCFAQQGIGVACINYGLAPAVKNPEQVKDVAQAVAWLRSHIAEYGGRPDALFLCGHSAGGQLVSLLATDPGYLKAEGLSLKDIRGVISVSGVYRVPEINLKFPLLTASDKPAPEGGQDRGGWRLNLFGSVFGDTEAARRAASPLSQVRAGLPPFLILYAARELPTLAPMAEEFAAALEKAGSEATLRKIKDRDHESILFNARAAEDPVCRILCDFIRQHTGSTSGGDKLRRSPGEG